MSGHPWVLCPKTIGSLATMFVSSFLIPDRLSDDSGYDELMSFIDLNTKDIL